MKFEIEAEVITKVVGMIVENNNKNAELTAKILDKGFNVVDKFLDAAMQSMSASEKRNQIRFEQEQEERKMRIDRAKEESEERRKDYAERQAERELSEARRKKEWEELNSSKNSEQ